ncbi:helix-turn-helix domain-containing protein [uncultured Chitinophaga sp.]|jgi:AraC-type DNA-binding domain-containing proteins|uniref:AraC family transcriptional regulator n=1 Tax=uncultured Chitinophaga sp. TaxID=339340 RepID=UPI00261064E9|nr:helix-turn-helix domain-containing protein [uncultured Chitinophaga sp.]
MISLQTYHPEKLYPFIKSFWRLEVVNAGERSYEEDIIPDGHHEIIFHLQPGTARRKMGQEQWLSEPDALFAGQTLQSYALQLQPGSVLYGIRFYPHTMALLFNVPASLFTDQLLAVSDIAGANALRQCVTDNAAHTFSRFEDLLAAKIAALQPNNGFQYVNAAVTTVLQHNGNVRVDALMRQTGVSVRHLDTSFKQFVGITPKTFCNIIRLNHFIRYRAAHSFKSLTECAYEAAFYDQSHLIRLFRSFTGKSPRAYFNDANYINAHFTVM